MIIHYMMLQNGRISDFIIGGLLRNKAMQDIELIVHIPSLILYKVMLPWLLTIHDHTCVFNTQRSRQNAKQLDKE